MWPGGGPGVWSAGGPGVWPGGGPGVWSAGGPGVWSGGGPGVWSGGGPGVWSDGWPGVFLGSASLPASAGVAPVPSVTSTESACSVAPAETEPVAVAAAPAVIVPEMRVAPSMATFQEVSPAVSANVFP